MVRVGVVDSDRWARENVAVVAAVKSAKPVHYLAAGEVGECAHCERKAAGSPRHLRPRSGARIELVDPDVPTISIYHVQESVLTHSHPRKVRAALQWKPGRPSRAAVWGACDIGLCATPALAVPECHVDGIAPRGPD